MDTWNPIKDSTINLSAAIAIFVCAFMASFTEINWAANVALGVVILELGVTAVWVLGRRRPAADPPART
ncbi:MAG TPA: hypothetical protein VFM41_01870 [Gaiella sp.]|nr:hypothetical protein [Gaiella sp.]